MSNPNALATRQTNTLLPDPQTWRTMAEMAEALFRSGLLPSSIKSPQAAVAVIQKGTELGIPPMAALTSIVVIQGKPTANAELMLALIYRDHGDNAIVFTHSTSAECEVAYKRRSWPKAQTYTFTMTDAKTAGLLGNQTWQKYPAAMLRARCISAVARMAFPDSIGGMFTSEELGADVDVVDGEVVIVEQRQPSMPLQDYGSGSISAPAIETVVTINADEPRGIVDVLNDELDGEFDPAGIERTEILQALYELTDKRDLSDVRQRIRNAGLDDDAEVERAYKRTYKRLHNGREDTSQAQPALIGG